MMVAYVRSRGFLQTQPYYTSERTLPSLEISKSLYSVLRILWGKEDTVRPIYQYYASPGLECTFAISRQ